METTMLPAALPTLRPWSVPAASMTGQSACTGGTTVVDVGTEPGAGTYGAALSVVPAAAAKPATSFGARAAMAQALIRAAGRQANADARSLTTLDPGSPPRDRRLL